MISLQLLNQLVISTQGLSPKTECLIIVNSIKNVIGNNGRITAEPSNEARKSQNADHCIIRRARN